MILGPHAEFIEPFGASTLLGLHTIGGVWHNLKGTLGIGDGRYHLQVASKLRYNLRSFNFWYGTSLFMTWLLSSNPCLLSRSKTCEKNYIVTVTYTPQLLNLIPDSGADQLILLNHWFVYFNIYIFFYLKFIICIIFISSNTWSVFISSNTWFFLLHPLLVRFRGLIQHELLTILS